jgi:hypothetical protein
MAVEFEISPGSPVSWKWFKNQAAIPEFSCNHGKRYCGVASISMVASAYGSCLSQDRIAYEIHKDHQTQPFGELSHAEGTSTNDAKFALAWALGMGPDEFEGDPHPTAARPGNPNQPMFDAAYFTPQNPPVVDFEVIKFWINAKRPIMYLSGDHYGVVAGYCRDDSGDEWIYIYDPINGPAARSFEEWQQNVAMPPPPNLGIERVIWVGPQAGSWVGVVSDQNEGVWDDSDSDGIMDIDEERFPPDAEKVDIMP